MATSEIKAAYDVIWEGTWTTGSINVPRINDYIMYIIVTSDGWPMLSARNANENVIASFNANPYNASSTSHQYIRSYDIRISGTTLTKTSNQFEHIGGAGHRVVSTNLGVSKIIGIC